MALVNIALDRLGQFVGQELGREKLVGLLQALGCDVEGHAVALRYRCGRCGHITEVLEHEDFNGACDGCGAKDLAQLASVDVVRVNLLPVRPDMFDITGLARAIRGYLGVETGLPAYRFETSGLSVRVEKGLGRIRPFIVAAVVRGIRLDDDTVRLLMKMQENLHWGLGRDRKRASIGVYDLDTVKPDFVYRPVKPDGIRFVPLFGMPEGEQSVTPREILERHPKGTAYKHLLEGFDAYPLLCDSGGRVLSMPPVINSEETKVTGRTKNIFVDVTGPDAHAVRRTLAVMTAAMTDLGAKVETVEVRYPDKTSQVTPDMAPQEMTVDPAETERVIGAKLGADEIVRLLERMRHQARVDGGRVAVQVAAYRADVMHEYDLIEDAAIAHGYANIVPRLVPTMTVGRPQRIEELCESCRKVMTGLGFMETMTLLFTSPDESIKKLGLTDEGQGCRVENPASVEQTMMRQSLIPGLLATFRVNTTAEMPQHIFETGECFELDKNAETGARATRRLAAGLAGPKAGYADARQTQEALARELSATVRFAPLEGPQYIPGRAARVSLERGGTVVEWGVCGEIHPAVLERFGVTQPVSVFEVDLTLV